MVASAAPAQSHGLRERGFHENELVAFTGLGSGHGDRPAAAGRSPEAGLVRGVQITVGILSACVSVWFLPGIFVIGVALSLALQRIRCPNCGHPVGWGEYRLFGLRFWWWRNLVK